MDFAWDGQTSFHTTLQIITKQGSKSLLIKVDPGTDVKIIPLSKHRKLFPVHFTKAGNLKQKSLHPTRHTWTAHNETPQQFLGFFIANIHHKTQPEVLPIRFYVFKNTISPKILLSYATSERLGIVKFQIPSEAPSTTLDIISTRKHVMFRTPLHTYRPIKPRNTGQQPLKPAIKKVISGPIIAKTVISGPSNTRYFSKTVISGQITAKSFIPGPFSMNSSLKQSLQDLFTTADVCDIIAMEKAFPNSFDHVGNMPGTYTMCLDPSVPPAQHARRKVPIEYKEQIEKALQYMEDLEIIKPVTVPTEWVSLITYPQKPDGTLQISLGPRDLNKAIIREHYKAPTL